VSDSVTPKQRRAIEALVIGSSIVAAAKAAGVSRQTVHTWMRQVGFAEALEAAEAEVRRTAVRRLTATLEKSVTTIIRLVETAEDEAVQLRAALAVAPMLRDLLAVDHDATPTPVQVNITPAAPFVFNHDAVVAAIAARSTAAYGVDE
jgi:transposase-like protein